MIWEKEMARIRTFKPEFLRHEDLQLLEKTHTGKYPMFVFMGLWSVCDKQGVFQWKPNQLKLDIYPFLDFNMAETLEILQQSKFINKFKADDGQYYGHVVNFEKHQVINFLEKKNPAKYPKPQEDQIEVPEEDTDEEEYCIDTVPKQYENVLKRRERERERERELNLHTQETTDPLSTAVAVASENIISKPKNKLELTEEQKPLFNAAKACFESDPKSKAILYQDKATTAREMRHLKTLVIRCSNIAKGVTADFMRTVLEHFSILTKGKYKGKVSFTPQSLITPWVWALVIDSLPEKDNPEIRESIRGMFDDS